MARSRGWRLLAPWGRVWGSTLKSATQTPSQGWGFPRGVICPVPWSPPIMELGVPEMGVILARKALPHAMGHFGGQRGPPQALPQPCTPWLTAGPLLGSLLH